MCGRIAQYEDKKLTEAALLAYYDEEYNYISRYNIGIGMKADVITSDKPNTIQQLTFGLTPFWAKKKMYLFNARAEGDDNPEDDPEHRGKGIIKKPAFRRPIRENRCLIICNGFYEGPKDIGLSKPYYFFLRKRRVFALAGIWDTWVHPITKQEEKGFAIITTTSNKIIRSIGHHRMPVILPLGKEREYLTTDHLATATLMLKAYPAEEMNGFPVDAKMKKPGVEGSELIVPTGELLVDYRPPAIEYPVPDDRMLKKRGISTHPGMTREEKIKLYYKL